MANVNRHPLITKEDEVRLGRQALKGRSEKIRKEARDKLVLANLRFVVQVAYQLSGYLKRGKYCMMDLVQEGNKGLIKAATMYNPDTGYRFITYAAWWIRANMQKFIMEQHSLVKIGTTGAQRKLFYKHTTVMEAMNSDTPDKALEMLATELNVQPYEILDMAQRMSGSDLSVDKELSFEHQTYTKLLDMMIDEKVPKADDLVDIKFLKEEVESSMKDLTPREQDIIHRRWLTDDKVTLEALGRDYGVSRERVRQIEAQAFNKMKVSLRNFPRELIQ
jgi:RNA polymerase sigma-32 factor